MHKEPWHRVVAATGFLLFSRALGATDWPQFGYDPAHSGFNPVERSYPTASGNSVLWHYALPTGADSAPVYLGGVATPSGTRNVLFVAALDGTLIALDANAKTLNVLWSKKAAGPAAMLTGAAVIDPGRLHVYASGADGKVHKYQVGTGAEVLTGGWPQISTLKPTLDKSASGLSVAAAQDGHTYLYSVTDSYYDVGDYQGHVTAIDLGTGTQVVFNAQCSDLTIHFVANGTTSGSGKNDCTQIAGGNSGIWGRAGAVYDTGTDRLFIATGNGLFDPANAGGKGIDWGDSVLALHANGTGSGSGMPADSYTPATYASLQTNDADLGSTSVALLPAPPGTAAAWRHLGLQGGKDGCLRLLNLANLSGQGAPGRVGGELQALNFPGGSGCSTGLEGHSLRTQPAVWVNPADRATWVYVVARLDGVVAYKIVLDGAGKPSLAQQWLRSIYYGTSPIVVNGVVYLMTDQRLYALDARTGASVVSDGSSWATLINGSHWQSPIIVEGRVYLIDGGASGSQLWAYQLDGTFRSGFD